MESAVAAVQPAHNVSERLRQLTSPAQDKHSELRDANTPPGALHPTEYQEQLRQPTFLECERDGQPMHDADMASGRDPVPRDLVKPGSDMTSTAVDRLGLSCSKPAKKTVWNNANVGQNCIWHGGAKQRRVSAPPVFKPIPTPTPPNLETGPTSVSGLSLLGQKGAHSAEPQVGHTVATTLNARLPSGFQPPLSTYHMLSPTATNLQRGLASVTGLSSLLKQKGVSSDESQIGYCEPTTSSAACVAGNVQPVVNLREQTGYGASEVTTPPHMPLKAPPALPYSVGAEYPAEHLGSVTPAAMRQEMSLRDSLLGQINSDPLGLITPVLRRLPTSTEGASLGPVNYEQVELVSPMKFGQPIHGGLLEPAVSEPMEMGTPNLFLLSSKGPSHEECKTNGLRTPNLTRSPKLLDGCQPLEAVYTRPSRVLNPLTATATASHPASLALNTVESGNDKATKMSALLGTPLRQSTASGSAAAMAMSATSTGLSTRQECLLENSAVTKLSVLFDTPHTVSKAAITGGLVTPASSKRNWLYDTPPMTSGKRHAGYGIALNARPEMPSDPLALLSEQAQSVARMMANLPKPALPPAGSTQAKVRGGGGGLAGQLTALMAGQKARQNRAADVSDALHVCLRAWQYEAHTVKCLVTCSSPAPASTAVVVLASRDSSAVELTEGTVFSVLPPWKQVNVDGWPNLPVILAWNIA